MLEKLKEIISRELHVSPDEITLDSSVKDDLGADSLALVDMAMAIEDEYDIEIPDADLADIETVSDLVEYLKTKVE